jgi:RHS repeat-associated protein
VWRWDSEPYGATAANEDPDGDSTAFTYNLRFPGQYRDAETGLNCNYFRDYDPQTGRYIESDRIGLDGGTNTYAYVYDDPVKLIDSTGEFTYDKPPPATVLVSPDIETHAGLCRGQFGFVRPT